MFIASQWPLWTWVKNANKIKRSVNRYTYDIHWQNLPTSWPRINSCSIAGLFTTSTICHNHATTCNTQHYNTQDTVLSKLQKSKYQQHLVLHPVNDKKKPAKMHTLLTQRSLHRHVTCHILYAMSTYVSEVILQIKVPNSCDIVRVTGVGSCNGHV